MARKIFFSTFMIALIIGTSTFMILESAGYYESHYTGEIYKGLWLALLLEVFSIFLAIIKPGSFIGKVFAKTTLFLLFLVLVATAGMKAVNPTLELLAKDTKQNDIESVLKLELQILNEDVETFKDKQRVNHAIASKQRRKIAEELKKSVVESDAQANTGIIAYVNIALLLIARILVQTANLYCASVLGGIWVKKKRKYRRRTKAAKKPVKRVKRKKASKVSSPKNDTAKIAAVA